MPAVNITVTVIDGVSGHPADGVMVAITGRLSGEQTSHAGGFTDTQGNFTHSPAADRLVRGESYAVALDVDEYYASLGLLTSYKQVTILVRIVNTQADYRIGMLITPFAHDTWGAR
jgi:5-hydroxyisourate hydrolase-like protein (transthyretin family)